MVNILDPGMMPDKAESLSLSVLSKMLKYRKEVATYFNNLESEKGMRPVSLSFSLAKGQDYARGILFRVIEEIAEALDSDSREHFLEELIDSYNYTLNFIQADEKIYDSVRTENLIYRTSILCFPEFDKSNIEHRKKIRKNGFSYENPHENYLQLGFTSKHIGAKLADYLRNRSWMENTQAHQFEGVDQVYVFLAYLSAKIFAAFESWDEFYLYYMAKNKVLEFRSQSNY